MAINFNELPKENPNNAVIPAGAYIGKIETAEMKTSKDPNKAMYLNVRYSLQDKNGTPKGSLYDIFTESDAEIPRYKLARFLIALGLDSLKTFELKDLPKLIIQKRLEIDVTIQKTEGYPDKNVVDVFTNDIFRPVSVDGGPTIAASDADDASNSDETDVAY